MDTGRAMRREKAARETDAARRRRASVLCARGGGHFCGARAMTWHRENAKDAQCLAHTLCHSSPVSGGMCGVWGTGSPAEMSTSLRRLTATSRP